MCYAIPGQIEKIDGKVVTVSYFGEKKRAINELEELQLGDYIYAQGGFVIEKITSLRAEEVLSLWKETFFELQELDLRLSRLEEEKRGDNHHLNLILDRALEEKPLTFADLLYILNLTAEPHLNLLYKTANFLRQKYHKNSCCVHGIIELSNYCRRNCHYCGISSSVSDLQRYRLSKEEIIQAAVEAVQKYGFKALVLQSGEDAGRSIGELAEAIKEIKTKVPVLIFISFGEIGQEGLKRLYEAGARGLLLRFETSNPNLYTTLHPGYSLDERMSELEKARELGYLLVSGGLIGLPGQSKEDIVRDLCAAVSLRPDMLSFGPFLPHPGTPLAKSHTPGQEDILKVLALARILEPKHSNIVVTTALETLNTQARKKGLLAGANSVMLNATPLPYRKLYDLYPTRAHNSEELSTQIQEVVSLLQSIGRAPTDLGWPNREEWNR